MPNIACDGLISVGESNDKVKSVIFDCADRYSPSVLMGIRAIDFWYEGSKITITNSDVTCYATTTYDSTFLPAFTFITSLSKTGTSSNTMWFSGANQVTNQRLICVFDEAKDFDGIVVNNCHDRARHLVAVFIM